MGAINKLGAAIRNLSGTNLSSDEVTKARFGTILGVKSTTLDDAASGLKNKDARSFTKFYNRVESTLDSNSKAHQTTSELIESKIGQLSTALHEHYEKRTNKAAANNRLTIPKMASKDPTDVANAANFILFIKDTNPKDSQGKSIFTARELKTISNYNHVKFTHLNTIKAGLQKFRDDDAGVEVEAEAGVGAEADQTTYAAVRHAGTSQSSTTPGGEVTYADVKHPEASGSSAAQDGEVAYATIQHPGTTTPGGEVTYADISQFQKRDGNRVVISPKATPADAPAGAGAVPDADADADADGDSIYENIPTSRPPTPLSRTGSRTSTDANLQSDAAQALPILDKINNLITNLYPNKTKSKLLKDFVKTLVTLGVTPERLQKLVITTSELKKNEKHTSSLLWVNSNGNVAYKLANDRQIYQVDPELIRTDRSAAFLIIRSLQGE